MRFTAAVLLLVLGACGSPGGTFLPDDPVDIDGSWQLSAGSLNDRALQILDDHPITLTIEGSEIGGTAACNHYGGRFEMRAGRLTIDDLAMTAMGCEEPVAAAEAAYTAALGSVDAVARDGDELVLSGPNVELRFTTVPDAPTAELTDTTWILETVFVGDVASSPVGEPATLTIRSDGSFDGSTGCRAFEGAWIEKSGRIVATRMMLDDAGCPPDANGQDSHVVSVIGDGFVATLDGELLTLTDPGSVGLVYRARD
jgi:heat shock protein HslJ